jgi:hypothetical protein
MVPIERVYQKMVYRPVTRQVVHDKPDDTGLTRHSIVNPTPKLTASSVRRVLSGQAFEDETRNMGLNRPISYQEFLQALGKTSEGRLSTGVAGSIWDRTPGADKNWPRDLAKSID